MVFGNKIDHQELTGIKIAFVISFYLIYHEGEAWMDTVSHDHRQVVFRICWSLTLEVADTQSVSHFCSAIILVALLFLNEERQEEVKPL